MVGAEAVKAEEAAEGELATGMEVEVEAEDWGSEAAAREAE